MTAIHVIVGPYGSSVSLLIAARPLIQQMCRKKRGDVVIGRLRMDYIMKRHFPSICRILAPHFHHRHRCRQEWRTVPAIAVMLLESAIYFGVGLGRHVR
jgi:hypothetical protein